MGLKSLDIAKEDFWAFAQFVEEERGYQQYWAQAVYKNKYGVNPEKHIKPIPARKPTNEFNKHIDEHIKQWYQQEVQGTDNDFSKATSVKEYTPNKVTREERKKLDEVIKQLEKLKSR